MITFTPVRQVHAPEPQPVTALTANSQFVSAATGAIGDAYLPPISASETLRFSNGRLEISAVTVKVVGHAEAVRGLRVKAFNSRSEKFRELVLVGSSVSAIESLGGKDGTIEDAVKKLCDAVPQCTLKTKELAETERRLAKKYSDNNNSIEVDLRSKTLTVRSVMDPSYCMHFNFAASSTLPQDKRKEFEQTRLKALLFLAAQSDIAKSNWLVKGSEDLERNTTLMVAARHAQGGQYFVAANTEGGSSGRNDTRQENDAQPKEVSSSKISRIAAAIGSRVRDWFRKPQTLTKA